MSADNVIEIITMNYIYHLVYGSYFYLRMFFCNINVKKLIKN